MSLQMGERGDVGKEQRKNLESRDGMKEEFPFFCALREVEKNRNFNLHNEWVDNDDNDDEKKDE